MTTARASNGGIDGRFNTLYSFNRDTRLALTTWVREPLFHISQPAGRLVWAESS